MNFNEEVWRSRLKKLNVLICINVALQCNDELLAHGVSDDIFSVFNPVHVTLAHPGTQGTLLNINLNILRKCYSIDTEFRRYTANIFDFYIYMDKN